MRRTLTHEKDQLPEIKQRLAALEEVLSPTNLIDDLCARAIIQGIFDGSVDEEEADGDDFSARYKQQ